MEKIVEQGLLYDFYGELLTEHQRKIYEAAVYDDLSLSEIADENGISKQGVHDLIKRCTRALQEYEDKLHMIRRFEAIRSEALELKRAASDDLDKDNLVGRINVSADRILEELG
jgi:predicted DNA-binding protein YlxM (UPF0122 family)